MQLKDSQTFQNLARAYSGECQAHARYKFIEYGARYNGYNALAEIIDKIVYNEFHHARMFYTFIQEASKETIDNIEICGGTPFREKWDLTENLRLASIDEGDETKIYPEFAKTAEKEGFKEIATLFTNITQVETCHQKLFADLYEQMSSGTMYKKEKPVKWKCADCGYEHTSTEAFKKCPICGAEQGHVMLKVEN